MERIKPYVYDPSQQIRKDLGDAATSVEQGFQNILDKKKQEYDFVNKVYEDAELLKKDLNLHNYELITKRSNDLIKETASVIKEKGKIDFTKLGELKNKVREIADAKKNSELSVQAVGDITKMVQANAANMRNPIDTLTKMMAKLRDEKYLFSPRNMYETAMEDYKNGLDYTKIIQDKLLELQKKGVPVQGQFDAPDGSLIEYKGVVPFGFKFDEGSKKLVPDVRVDEKTGQTINPIEGIQNSIDPELWEGYMKQTVGFGQMLNPNPSDYATDLINSTLGGSVSYSVKKDALTRNTERVEFGIKQQDFESKAYKNTPEYREWEKSIEDQKVRNSTISANASAQNAAIANQRFGLSLKQYKLDMADKGYVEQPDGSLVYNPKNDKRGDSSGDPSGLAMNSDTSVFIKKKFDNKNIKAVLGNSDGSLTLLNESGNGKTVVKGKDINRFLNQLTEKERTSVNKILRSVSGSNQQVQQGGTQNAAPPPSSVNVSRFFPEPDNQPE